MTNEELILEKLDRLEAQIQPLIQTSEKMGELKDDLTPIANHAVKLLIEELTKVEPHFQLEDVTDLVREAVVNTRNFTFAMKQMANIIEFVQDMQPLINNAVPDFIQMLDDMEQKGVFRIIRSTVELRKKVASAYTADDIEVMGDGIVAMLGLFKALSDPKAIALLEKLAQIPSHVELENAQSVGLLGVAKAGFTPEVSQGLGVLMELTKAMGKIAPEATKA